MEEELIKKAKALDQEAFSLLMKRCAKSMYKVAKAILKDDWDVKDAMQETALTCWEKMDTLQNDNYFKTWMIRILINHCNTIYRKKHKYILNNIIPDTAAYDDAYSNVEWMELLSCLSEKYRIVIVLYYVEGFKVKEIAAILNIKESTVKERMSTARKKMEKYYRKERSGMVYEKL